MRVGGEGPLVMLVDVWCFFRVFLAMHNHAVGRAGIVDPLRDTGVRSHLQL